ncbi:uncharacterized protein LOC134537967 [Bacillus rossius redtenbacheri]|uniref:uncharacterized protein LOC134537967 n=1 Tax=Bacillus rossius redtenbacheri TaxID=93214 RepID=UPI002FDC8AA6
MLRHLAPPTVLIVLLLGSRLASASQEVLDLGEAWNDMVVNMEKTFQEMVNKFGEAMYEGLPTNITHEDDAVSDAPQDNGQEAMQDGGWDAPGDGERLASADHSEMERGSRCSSGTGRN